MKKLTKRILAVVLALVMGISAAVLPAGAAYEPTQDYASIYPELHSMGLTPDDTQYPTIILPGINHSNMYALNEDGTFYLDAKGNKVGGGLILIDSTSIAKKVMGVVPSLLFSLFFRAEVGNYSSKLYNAVCDIFSMQKMNKDGELENPLYLEQFDVPVSQMDNRRGWFYRMLPMEPYADLVGEDNIFLYTFPLYGDPMQSADGLNDYIDMVLTRTGAEKVNIVCVSLGGSILTGWLDTERADFGKINRIVNVVALLNGTELIADFMARDFNISDEFLYHDFFPLIMKEMNGSATLGYVINILLRLMPRSVFEKTLTAAFSALLDTMIINDPQFWAMLGADDYDELADRYLRDGEHEALLAKTERYQRARLNRANNLQSATAEGVEFYTITGYNMTYTEGEYNFFGIVNSSATANSDAIIGADSTSLGATTAPAGKKLDITSIPNFDSKYLSPDGTLYAGTCLYPDHAFFFNRQHHEIGRNDVAIRLAAAILTGMVDDVNTTELFPQFNGSRNTRSLVRSDSGKLWDAQAALAQAESYPADKLARLSTAYDSCVEMLNNTICDSKSANEAYDELYDAMAELGIYSPRGKTSRFETMTEKMLSKLNDMLLKTYR